MACLRGRLPARPWGSKQRPMEPSPGDGISRLQVGASEGLLGLGSEAVASNPEPWPCA